MKHRISAAALAAAVALTLAACSSSPEASPSPSAPADTAAADLLASVQWADGDDDVPTITFDVPVTISNSAALLVEDGDGDALAEGNALSLDYVVNSSVDGSVLYSTFEAGSPEVVTLANGGIDPVLYDVLVTAHVGAHVLYATPDPSAQDDSSIVMAMIVSGASEVLARAEGTTVVPPGDLPVVTLDETGKPSIDFTGATMPTELVSQTLLEGAGEPVAEGQQVTIHYTGWLWDGEQFDSSWDRGAPSTFALRQGGLIDGWVQGLPGKTVGSQVLLVIPSDLGYGAEGNGTIPGDATLVFVVDILAAQ